MPLVRLSVTPDFLSSLLALATFMRLSLMKAAHAAIGGAPCRKSGYVGRKRWAQSNNRSCSIHQQIHFESYSPRVKVPQGRLEYAQDAWKRTLLELLSKPL